MADTLQGHAATAILQSTASQLPSLRSALTDAAGLISDELNALPQPKGQRDWANSAFMLSTHSDDGTSELVFACGDVLQAPSDVEALLSWADECQLAADASQVATHMKLGRVGRHVRSLVCVVLPAAAGSRPVMIMVDGSGDRNSFNAADRRETRLHMAIADYVRMARLGADPSKQMKGLIAALNCIDIGICIVDSHGKAMFSNRAADQLLQQGDGLRWDHGSITAREIADTLKLHVALRHVIGSRGNPGGRVSGQRIPIVPVGRSDGKRPLMVALMPVEGETTSSDDPAAILCFHAADGELGELLGPLCKLHALSPVETRLVVQLAAGATLNEAAASMRVKEQTARSYLKQIFQKTSTKRQSELVRLFLSNILHTWRDFKPELV